MATPANPAATRPAPPATRPSGGALGDVAPRSRPGAAPAPARPVCPNCGEPCPYLVARVDRVCHCQVCGEAWHVPRSPDPAGSAPARPASAVTTGSVATSSAARSPDGVTRRSFLRGVLAGAALLAVRPVLPRAAAEQLVVAVDFGPSPVAVVARVHADVAAYEDVLKRCAGPMLVELLNRPVPLYRMRSVRAVPWPVT